MKRKLTYASILVLTIIAFVLFRRACDAPLEGESEPEGRATASSPSRNGNPPDEDGGTPPLYLTQEQQMNPVRGPMRGFTPEERMAKQKGARAKFKVHVVDSMRAPVPDANVEVSFITQYTVPVDVQKAESDKDGLCSFEGVSASAVMLRANKEGYYKTEREHYLFIQDAEWNCVKDGKWQPWDATLELVLKEKRDPITLHVKRLEIHFPKKGISYGFDCTAGDLVEPDGKGKTADLIFTYTGERTTQDYNIELRMETVNGGGFIRGASDMWSEMKSPYTAPAKGFEPQMLLWARSIPDVITEDSWLKRDEYLVFETYSRGEQPCVGKIQGALFMNKSFKYPEGGSTSYLLYYFNPFPGDRRIESNPQPLR